MIEASISEPLHTILSKLTGEQRIDAALNLATKDLLHFKLREAEQETKRFEDRRGMTFPQFQQAWQNDQIADKYSYEVEKDYWEWEAAHAEIIWLREMIEKLA